MSGYGYSLLYFIFTSPNNYLFFHFSLRGPILPNCNKHRLWKMNICCYRFRIILLFILIETYQCMIILGFRSKYQIWTKGPDSRKMEANGIWKGLSWFMRQWNLDKDKHVVINKSWSFSGHNFLPINDLGYVRVMLCLLFVLLSMFSDRCTMGVLLCVHGSLG